MMLTSLQNPKIKDVVRLQNRRFRDETGLFLIEGYREIDRAVKGGVKIPSLFVCEELFLKDNEPTLIQKIQQLGGTTYFCSSSVFHKISYRDRPDGLIAIGEQMDTSLSSLPLTSTSLFVIAEGIEKPGNLGSILRSADGVGADGVIVCDRCTDIYNPNVVRASVGTLFTLPIIEGSLENIFQFLKEHQIKMIATSPDAKIDYTKASLTGPIAIIVGSEQLGLSDFWLKNADQTVSIPMKGIADSLNVATATTLLLYEALRQKNSV